MSEAAAAGFAPRHRAHESPSQRLQLKEGGMLKVQVGNGVDLMAIEGRLWIIQEADVPDLELGPGQSLQIGNGGVALIQALQPSTLSLVAVRRRDQPLRAPMVSMVGGA